MTRGWNSTDLPVVCDDERLWTVNDAIHALGTLPGDPDDQPAEKTAMRLRELIRTHHALTGELAAVGKRRSTRPGQPGRYARVYHAIDFIDLYEQMGNKQAPPAAA